MNIMHRPLPHGPASQGTPSLIVVHSMIEWMRKKDMLEYLALTKGIDSEIYQRAEAESGDMVFAADFLEYDGTSAHLLIGTHGELIRCREDNQGAWHAKGFNKNSLGVEVLVPDAYNYGEFLPKIKEPWVAPVQLDTLVYAVREWLSLYHITRGVEEHSKLDPGRKYDPGKGFPREEFQRLIYAK